MNEIKDYKYACNFREKAGYLMLLYQKAENWSEWIKIKDASEFNVIISMLKNEESVYFYRRNGEDFFQTNTEEINNIGN